MTAATTDSLRPPLAHLPHVLCVDDEPRVLEGLRDILRRTVQVRVAQSGPEGLELLRRDAQGFAVVISDEPVLVVGEETIA